MFNKICILIIASLAALTAQSATAQTLPRQPSNIDQRFRIQAPPVTEADKQNALLTGDTDIVLMQKAKLFTMHGSFNTNYSDNAALSTTDTQSDYSGQMQVGMRVGTRIGGRVDVFADVGVLGVRYSKLARLDYSALTAAIGAQVSLKSFDLSATYQPSVIYDRKFSNRQLTQHRLSLGVSRQYMVGPVAIVPSVSAERVVADPEDYNNWAGGADLTLSVPLSKKRPISFFATAGYEKRSYDSYFPDLLGSDRRDDRMNAGIGVTYNLGQRGSFNFAYNYGKNDSTSDVNGYVAHSGTLGISGRLRF
jgi:hypothetical protein